MLDGSLSQRERECDLGKWQWVRLVEPFMMLLAEEIRSLLPTEGEWKADTLKFFGFTTIAVNLYFFLVIGGWR
jgi:hypothetical protein